MRTNTWIVALVVASSLILAGTLSRAFAQGSAPTAPQTVSECVALGTCLDRPPIDEPEIITLPPDLNPPLGCEIILCAPGLVCEETDGLPRCVPLEEPRTCASDPDFCKGEGVCLDSSRGPICLERPPVEPPKCTCPVPFPPAITLSLSGSSASGSGTSGTPIPINDCPIILCPVPSPPILAP